MADLTKVLCALVGKPMTDAKVKATLKGLGFALVKKHEDSEFVHAAGLSYRGQYRTVKGKRVFLVESVTFYRAVAAKSLAPMPAPLEDYTGALPEGIVWADDRAKLRKKLGKPDNELDDFDEWKIGKDKRVYVGYVAPAHKKSDSVTFALARLGYYG